MKSRTWSSVVVALLGAVLVWLLASSDTPSGGEDSATPIPRDVDPSEPVGARRRARPAPAEAPVDAAPTVPAAAEAQAEPAQRVLRVTVKARETGAGLADARVVVEERGAPRRETRTGADGVAVFSPAPEDGADVAAYARGRVRAFGWVGTPEPGADRELALTLALGERLAGRVVDASGSGVAGVHIDLDEGGSLGNLSSSSAGPLLGGATSGADGAFAFEGVPAGELVTLMVVHRGFAHYERTVRLAPGGARDPVLVRLAQGGTLAGTVRGADLRPVAGARVLAAVSDSQFLLDDPDGNIIASGGSQARPLSTRTDADGRFELHGLHFDATYVAVAATRDRGRSERHGDLVARAGAETLHVDFRLQPFLTLVVDVVDAAGARIEGATVLGLTGDVDYVAAAPDGSFALEGLAPGDVVFDVDADGFVKRRVTHAVAADERITVRLEPGMSISGTAVNDVGEPLADARIRVMRPIGPQWRDLEESLADTKTDADGRFEVGGLHSGPHAVLCWATGHGRGKLEPVEAGARGVRVVSPRQAVVTITLRVPDGAAAPVEVQRQISREGGGNGVERDWTADGRFEEGIAPGRVAVAFRADGYAPVAFELDLAAGETRDLGEVLLGPGVTATGTVVDLQGRPVANAEVAASPTWVFDSVVAQTDGDGAFRLPLLSAWVHEVEITAPGFLGTSFERDTRREAVWNVTLARGGLVSGTVRTRDGVGITEGSVRVVGLGGGDADDRTDFAYPAGAGRYGVRVRPGRYRVEYQPREGDAIPGREITLAEGGSATVDFELAR